MFSGGLNADGARFWAQLIMTVLGFRAVIKLFWRFLTEPWWGMRMTSTVRSGYFSVMEFWASCSMSLQRRIFLFAYSIRETSDLSLSEIAGSAQISSVGQRGVMLTCRGISESKSIGSMSMLSCLRWLARNAADDLDFVC